MHHRQKLNDNEIKYAQYLWKMGWSAKKIGNEFQVTGQCIYYHCRHIPRYNLRQMLHHLAA